MTAQQDPEIAPFSKFIGALDLWLEQVVLIGGWAPRLYRLDSRARNLEYPPLTTLDGDVAVPTKLKVEESNVRKRLLEAGFKEEFVGEDQPSGDSISLQRRWRLLRRVSGPSRRKRI